MCNNQRTWSFIHCISKNKSNIRYSKITCLLQIAIRYDRDRRVRHFVYYFYLSWNFYIRHFGQSRLIMLRHYHFGYLCTFVIYFFIYFILVTPFLLSQSIMLFMLSPFSPCYHFWLYSFSSFHSTHNFYTFFSFQLIFVKISENSLITLFLHTYNLRLPSQKNRCKQYEKDIFSIIDRIIGHISNNIVTLFKLVKAIILCMSALSIRQVSLLDSQSVNYISLINHTSHSTRFNHINYISNTSQSVGEQRAP